MRDNKVSNQIIDTCSVNLLSKLNKSLHFDNFYKQRRIIMLV